MEKYLFEKIRPTIYITKEALFYREDITNADLDGGCAVLPRSDAGTQSGVCQARGHPSPDGRDPEVGLPEHPAQHLRQALPQVPVTLPKPARRRRYR